MGKIIVTDEPQNPKAFKGNIESVVDSNVETSGPGYSMKVIVDVPSMTKDQLINMADQLEEQYRTTNPEWFDGVDDPKFRASLPGIFKQDGSKNQDIIDYLAQCTASEAVSVLTDIGKPTVAIL